MLVSQWLFSSTDSISTRTSQKHPTSEPRKHGTSRTCRKTRIPYTFTWLKFLLEDLQDIYVDRFKAYWESLNGSTLPLNHPTIRANVEDAVFDPATGTAHDFLTGSS